MQNGETTYINVAALHPNINNLGPGLRFVIWVQGCPFTCKNCISPNWIPFKVVIPFSVNHLAELILAEKSISGITISGGEPMMQAGRLSQLLKIVKSKNKNLDVISFTGFEKENLVWQEAQTFMQDIDVLITGQYKEKQNDNKGLRGSSNQRIIFLTDKLKEHEDYFFETKRNLNFYIETDEVLMTGIPEKGFNW